MFPSPGDLPDAGIETRSPNFSSVKKYTKEKAGEGTILETEEIKPNTVSETWLDLASEKKKKAVVLDNFRQLERFEYTLHSR